MDNNTNTLPSSKPTETTSTQQPCNSLENGGQVESNVVITPQEVVEQQAPKKPNKVRKRKRNKNRSASTSSASSDPASKKKSSSRKLRRRRHHRRRSSSSCSSCASTSSSPSSSSSSCSSTTSSASESKRKRHSKHNRRHHRRHGHGSKHHCHRHHHRRHKTKHKKAVAMEMFQPALAGHGLVAATTANAYHAIAPQLPGAHFQALYGSAAPCLHAASANNLLQPDHIPPRRVRYRRRVSSSSSGSTSPEIINRVVDRAASSRGSRRIRSISRHSFHRDSDRMAVSAYPGLPPPIIGGGLGPRGTFRHLPTKDLCDSDFSPNSRVYVPTRNEGDGGWRSKMKKIKRHESWDGVKAKLIDCHCHLDFLFIKISYFGYIDDYFKVFSDAFLPSFDCLVTVFCNPISLMPDQFRIWSRILECDRVYACCGIHPHASHYYTDEIKRNLMAALAHPKVRAVGECGIDRSHKNRIDVEIQARALKSQLKIALQMNKPVVLHAREAYKETLRVVKKVLPTDHRIHLHCYTSSWDIAKEWMSYYTNVFFGFTPLLTFSSHPGVIATIEKLPLSRILLETDSPYFVPRELYQDTNLCHPGFVYSVAETISKIKNIDLNEVVSQTERNARAFYDMDH